MKHLTHIIVLALLVLVTGCDSTSSITGPEKAPTDATVRSMQAAGVATDATLDTDRYLVLLKGNGVPASFAADVEALGGAVEFSHEIGFAVVSGLDSEAAASLDARSDISEVQADVALSMEPAGQDDPLSATISSPSEPATAAIYPRQWNMRTINAEAAWDAGKLGDAGVTVAVLDTGIDYGHPDLAGLVDLDRSISFEFRDDPFAAAFFPNRNPVTDLHFHGTHVAATVASNAIGAAGVTSQTTLMGVKVCSFLTFDCITSNVFAGILHAVDNGADVVNMSLGGAFAKPGAGQFVGLINRIFSYAHRNDVTMVVAAGNAATDLDANGNAFAAYCDAPNAICVSATGPLSRESDVGPWEEIDAPAFYTNFGRSAITVAAPGGSTGDFVRAACTQTSLLPGLGICGTGLFVIGVRGTSMATPHVAGLAALLKAEGYDKPSQIKARITKGADDLGQRGTDKFYGKGRINVASTLGL